mmetsp:Transcript_6287/g.9976  ORF Transcript_6287/g.9976 Transcript_6287/m.9976 type:complete len:276 (-) Transcript_6287:224-1051(-)|eukprot:CAMPEP_0202685922 /NCGR_PEP_ID=MMETSP1385-20130828/1736_1 /ASSEMBLY_ACC=CAM_ASM_000861 /TAXON_ID=933848 /ORGANISM="Elphidium margaritaceum" /LENGTH=275 /DNA_ID=CAMNT_0049340395 /DNA_START=115 /DNA_END=942 /DNA_ORIENTATION=-
MKTACLLSLVAMVYGQTTTEDIETTEIDCDSDLTQFAVEPTGQSAKFKFYDACGDKFISFNVDSLGDVDSDGEEVTSTTVTTLASASGWEFGDDSGEQSTYNGADCVYNRLEVTGMKAKGTVIPARLVLETRLFREEVEILNETVPVNTLKFDMELYDYAYASDDNDFQICIGIMTNKGGSAEGDDDNRYDLEGFAIDNLAEANCVADSGNSTVNVTIAAATKGGSSNHLTLCYTFENCAGDILYDPLVYITEDSAVARGVIAALFMAIFAVFSV